MKKVKVITDYRADLQKKIDDFIEKNPEINIIDYKPGYMNDYGYAILYIIYEEPLKL